LSDEERSQLSGDSSARKRLRQLTVGWYPRAGSRTRPHRRHTGCPNPDSTQALPLRAPTRLRFSSSGRLPNRRPCPRPTSSRKTAHERANGPRRRPVSTRESHVSSASPSPRDASWAGPAASRYAPPRDPRTVAGEYDPLAESGGTYTLTADHRRHRTSR